MHTYLGIYPLPQSDSAMRDGLPRVLIAEHDIVPPRKLLEQAHQMFRMASHTQMKSE